MAIEIRRAKPEELDRVHFIAAYSFTGDRSEEGRERHKHIEEKAPAYVLLEDGDIAASLKVYGWTMLVNGAPVRTGGVSGVSCLPEHRRRGYVGQLLRFVLEQMREQGQPLSTLYTPHPALYRKYGYMVAASNLKFTLHPKRLRPYNPSAARGRAVRITEEDQPLVEAIYKRFSEGRTGQHVRDDWTWREAFFRRIYDDKRKLADVAVWREEDGEATGYLCYQDSRGPPPMASSKVWLREFVALTGSAYQGLLSYLLSHDLSDEIFWYGPLDDPLPYALDDSYQVQREYVDDLMLRVVDVEKAVAARPAGPGAPDGAFAVTLTDASCPWNQGTWRIENQGGRLSAKRADGAGNLAMEAATFGGVYDGFMRTSDALRSGLAEGDREAALLADRVLAPVYPPNGSDFF